MISIDIILFIVSLFFLTVIFSYKYFINIKKVKINKYTLDDFQKVSSFHKCKCNFNLQPCIFSSKALPFDNKYYVIICPIDNAYEIITQLMIKNNFHKKAIKNEKEIINKIKENDFCRGFSQFCCNKFGFGFGFIWMDIKTDLDVIVHEFSHLSDNMFDFNGVDKNDGEKYQYFIGAHIDNFVSFVNGDLINENT